MEQFLIPCPWCECTVAIPRDATAEMCPRSARAVDVQAQLCYLRGCDAFADGRQAKPEGRRRLQARDVTPGTIISYLQAYTGFQEALRGELSDDQLRSAVQMMADMAQTFAARLMVSGEEASYWQKRAVEISTRRELGELRARLAQSSSGIIGCVRRSRDAVRLRQLAAAHERLQGQISSLEESVFVSDRGKPPSPGAH